MFHILSEEVGTFLAASVSPSAKEGQIQRLCILQRACVCPEKCCSALLLLAPCLCQPQPHSEFGHKGPRGQECKTFCPLPLLTVQKTPQASGHKALEPHPWHSSVHAAVSSSTLAMAGSCPCWQGESIRRDRGRADSKASKGGFAGFPCIATLVVSMHVKSHLEGK